MKLLGCGDIMLGEHPIMVGWGISREFAVGRELYPFAHVHELLAGADLVFGNLESALSPLPRGRSLSARECIGPAQGAELLRIAGFHALSVANNHIQQHGPKSLRMTLDLLGRAGLLAVGEAAEGGRRCRPVDLEIGGLPLRLLAYSLRPRQFFSEQPLYAEPDEESLLVDVRAGRDAGRTVVCSLHWGDEFVARPSPSQIQLGRRLIEAGATLVLGHHPHVLQGGEHWGDGYIAYSLGNFVFDMIWEERLRRTACLQALLAPQRVVEVDWIPIWIGDDFAPRIGRGAEQRKILHFLEDAAVRLRDQREGFENSGETESYLIEVRKELLRHRYASHRHFLRNLRRYELRIMAEIAGRAVLRRLGFLRD
ncbi:MAG: CapA family protein [Candidatus Eisenbacteria sp.]|nr:CapA family protein [Candidatus Eisenbacteria bacterium]